MITFWVKVKNIILKKKLSRLLFGQILRHLLVQHLVTLQCLLKNLKKICFLTDSGTVTPLPDGNEQPRIGPIAV